MSADSPGRGERPDLSHLAVVVTRPRKQGAATVRMLRTYAADSLQFPVLDIRALLPETVVMTFDPEHVGDAALIIFISANAVQFGLPLLRAWGGPAPQTKIFAIGQATANALSACGIDAVITPESGNDSEALLTLPQLQNVAGQHIILVRGVSEAGGRTLLADSLVARGARLWPLECYERRAVSASTAEKRKLSARLQAGTVHAILVLSVETLDSLVTNLQEMLGSRAATLLVPHPRVAAAARAYGFERVEVVPMGDDALPLALYRLKPTLLAQKAR